MPRTPKPSSTKPTGAPKRPRLAPALAFRRNLPSAGPTPEAIATRAYELFEQSGYQHGRDVEHWLTAEQEILTAIGQAVAV